MRYILSMLILVTSLSFFTIACGGDTTSTGDGTCSPTNTSGSCDTGKHCNNGVCVNDACTPNCAGKTCGDDGCGGTCGSCNAGETCNAGTCEAGGTCTPNCAGKTCGDDGCGGSCGSCNMGETCNAAGTCEAGGTCTPNCEGKTCGGDGCGSTCGTCNGGETCNSAGTCETSVADGQLGGNCSDQIACADNTNLCLGPQGGQATCYQACNGTNDTSCTQTNYTCQKANDSIGFVCLPDTTGNTAIGGDCSSEACVAEAICLNPDAPTCYEKCSAATDTCTTSGYKCIDTGNASIGWVCMEPTQPGTVPVGGTCDQNNNCVAEASCLGPQGGPYTCYEKCTGSTDTCSQANYTCQAAAGANFCMQQAQPGTAQPGETCSADNRCVETAMCLTSNGSTTSTCYEKCTGASDTCSQTGYACQDTGVAGIDWICMQQSQPGNAQIGETCSADNNCVAEASCLGPQGGPYTCYEKCDPNTGGTCSQSGYTCTAAAGANFCMQPQGN